MTDKELRKLTKPELLKLMLKQQKRIEKLEEALKEVREMEKNQTVRMNHAGSIAEAGKEIQRIFAEAQREADAYMGVQQLPPKQQVQAKVPQQVAPEPVPVRPARQETPVQPAAVQEEGTRRRRRMQ